MKGGTFSSLHAKHVDGQSQHLEALETAVVLGPVSRCKAGTSPEIFHAEHRQSFSLFDVGGVKAEAIDG